MLVALMKNSTYAQDGGQSPTPSSEISPILLSQVELIESQVRDLRQLSSSGLERITIEPAQLHVIADTQLQTTYSAQQAEDDAVFYKTFGFIENLADLGIALDNQLKAYPSTLLYDLAENLIYLPPVTSLSAFESTVYARQYAYALQADAFPLETLLNTELFIQSPDQAFAIQALIEGDAQLVTENYIKKFIADNPSLVNDLIRQSASVTNTGAIAPILMNEVLFPAQAGRHFVKTLYDTTNDWRLVDLVYERPPLSTEHILHPELYLLYEAPHSIAIRPMQDFFNNLPDTGQDWTLLRDQSLGEFYLRQHLQLVLEPEVVDVMASGWGGDRFMLYTHNRETLMVWRLSWDSYADFVDFDTRYTAYLGDWLDIGGSVVRDGLICWASPSKNVCKSTIGEDVLIVFAPTLDMSLQLIQYQLAGSHIIG